METGRQTVSQSVQSNKWTDGLGPGRARDAVGPRGEPAVQSETDQAHCKLGLRRRVDAQKTYTYVVTYVRPSGASRRGMPMHDGWMTRDSPAAEHDVDRDVRDRYPDPRYPDIQISRSCRSRPAPGTAAQAEASVQYPVSSARRVMHTFICALWPEREREATRSSRRSSSCRWPRTSWCVT